MNTIIKKQTELFNTINDDVPVTAIERCWHNYPAYVDHYPQGELDKQDLLIAILDDGTEVECQYKYNNFCTDAYVRSPTCETRGSFELPSNWQTIRMSSFSAGRYQSGVIARKNKDGKSATTFPFPKVERI